MHPQTPHPSLGRPGGEQRVGYSCYVWKDVHLEATSAFGALPLWSAAGCKEGRCPNRRAEEPFGADARFFARRKLDSALDSGRTLSETLAVFDAHQCSLQTTKAEIIFRVLVRLPASLLPLLAFESCRLSSQNVVIKRTSLEDELRCVEMRCPSRARGGDLASSFLEAPQSSCAGHWTLRIAKSTYASGTTTLVWGSLVV